MLVLSCRWAQSPQPFTREPLEIEIMSHSEIASDKRIYQHLSGLILQTFNINDLLQSRVFRFGFVEDEHIGVDIFPQCYLQEFPYFFYELRGALRVGCQSVGRS